MFRTHTAAELKPSKNVKIGGWVHEKRNLGSLMFILIRESTGIIQVTAKKGVTDESLLDSLSKLKKESCVVIEGECVANKSAPNGMEIVPKNLIVLSESDSILPIDMSPKIKTTLDKRLDARSVDLRRPENQAIFKIESMIMQEMSDFLKKENFMQIFTPSLMGVASESGSEVFSVVYFDKEAFLRQDPQLHRQLTIAGGMERIYELGPSWRAELSHTTRHLCEHRTIAAEIAFIEDEYDVMKIEEGMILYMMNKIKKDCAKELEMFGIDFDVPKEIPVVEFPQVYDILEEAGVKAEYGSDFGSDGEKAIGDYAKKKFKSDFVFVNKFPFAVKPFYVMKFDDTWARSTDLLFKGTEISSGGQREHRYEKIVEQARQKGMNPDSVDWFSKFFKYGVPPHGGFSVGIERLTAILLNLQNIREAVLFPRDTERLVP